jgi:hypothetical protein
VERSRPKPVDPAEDLGNSALGTAASASWKATYRPCRTNPGADFDQLLAQRVQRPVLDVRRQGQRAQEIGRVVGEGVELEPRRVVAEGVAGEPRPADRVLANVDPVFYGDLRHAAFKALGLS